MSSIENQFTNVCAIIACVCLWREIPGGFGTRHVVKGWKMESQTPEYENNSESDDVICPRKARKNNSRATNVFFIFVF